MNAQNTVKKTYPVLNMTCSSCARRVENTLSRKNGVVNASVNFAAANVTIEYSPDIISAEGLRDIIQENGYDMLIDEDDEEADILEDIHSKKTNTLKKRAVWAIILSLPIVIIGMFFMNIPYANLIMWILSTPVIFWLGRDFFTGAWKQAKHQSANMDTLVVLSTGIAYIFSVFNTLYPQFWIERSVEPHVYFEAAAVIIAFILLGRLLEEKAKGNTSSAIKKLMGLQPKTVTIINAEDQHIQISIDKVKTGDVILVKPGEKIAVDGTILSGSSYVDESTFSGEPAPVLKNTDSKVFAGTINQKGSFNFIAQKIGKNTMLAQVIQMVQNAQGSKAPVQKLVDKIAGIFVPIVIAISILAFIVWVTLDSTNGLTHGLLALVTVLIIACPCALGLATPTAIMVGIGKSAERGILIKDAESLEIAKNINVVVLDKTGTITEGRPEVTDVFWLNNNNSKQNILLGLEKQSEHPLAEAVVRYFNNTEIENITAFESITGKGVQGSVGNETYFAGNRRLLNENNININRQLIEKEQLLSSQNKSIIWFSDTENAIAVVGITDKIKNNSPQAIKQLQNNGIEVYMLTGDIENTATQIAKQVGIKHYRAEILPHQKAEFVKLLQAQGKVVAMVGDGINDSAALAQADLSIAMGKGSDIAMDVAKMTIISSDLTKIAEAIKLSKQTVSTIRQNLFWAFIYNLIGIPIAAGILFPINGFLLNPMIAGAAMALSSVSVVTNSLLLKYKK